MEKDKTARRWGDGRRAAPDYAHEQILDAAVRCYQKYSFEEANMGKIALEAKISRTTIYRHFKNRDEVILGVIKRELYHLIGVLNANISPDATFAEMLVETLVIADQRLHESPIFQVVVRETPGLMSRVQSYSTEVIGFTGLYFRERFDAAKAAGELRDAVDYAELMDWIAHVGAGYIMLPSGARKAGVFRSMVWRYMIPAIIRPEAIPPTWQ